VPPYFVVDTLEPGHLTMQVKCSCDARPTRGAQHASPSVILKQSNDLSGETRRIALCHQRARVVHDRNYGIHEPA
jgi:hypothetical protein